MPTRSGCARFGDGDDVTGVKTEEQMTLGAKIAVAGAVAVTRGALKANIAAREIAIATCAEDARLVFGKQFLDEVFERRPRRRERGHGFIALGLGRVVIVEPAMEREIGGGGGFFVEGVGRKVVANRSGEHGGIHGKVSVSALTGGRGFLRETHASGAATLELSDRDLRGSEAGEGVGERGDRQVVGDHDGPA